MAKIFTNHREQRLPVPLPALNLIHDRVACATVAAAAIMTVPHLVRFEYGLFDRGRTAAFVTVSCCDEWTEADAYKDLLRVAEQIAANLPRPAEVG